MHAYNGGGTPAEQQSEISKTKISGVNGVSASHAPGRQQHRRHSSSQQKQPQCQAQPRYVVYEENDDDNYDCDQEDAETTAERRSVMQQMCDVRQQTEQLLSHLQAPQESQPQATTPPMQMHSPATHKHVQDLERRGRRKHKPRKHPNATTPPNGSTSSAIAAASMLQQQPPQQQHSQHDFYEDPRLQQDQSSQETGDAQYSQTQQDSRMFYSPLFQEYKSLRFYGGLLATTQQYAKHLDTTDKTGLRLLVWKELLHIAGISESGQTQIPTLDPLSASTSTVHQEHNTSSSGTTAPSSTAPHSSTQSDQAPNTTEPNVVKTENGTTSSPQNASYEESSNILATSHDQKPVPNQNAQPPLTAQELANVPDGPVFDFIITKLLGYEQVNLAVLDLMYAAFLHAQRRYPDIFRHMFTPVPEDNSSTKPCDAIWSFGVQATLLQLHLLQHWTPLLEELSPSYKLLTWETCLLHPAFKNYHQSSFQKTLALWSENPLMHSSAITILFGALGFLYSQNLLPCEFFYPGAKIPVFKKEVMSVLPVEPPIKRGPSFSAELGKLLPPMADTGTEEEQPEFPGTKKPRVSAVLTVRRKPDLPISGSPKLPDSKTSSLEQSPLCLLANNTLQQVELASRQRQEFSSLVSQVSPPKLGPISPAMLAAVNFTSQLISMPMNSPLSFSAYNSGLLPNNLPTTNHTLPLSSLPANAVAANLLKQMNPTGTFPLMQLPPPVKASQIAQQQQQPSTPNRSRHSTTTTPATQTSQHNSTTPQQSRGAGGLKISSILS